MKLPNGWLIVLLIAPAAGCANGPPASVAATDQDTLLAPGQALYWRGEYDSASAMWGGALIRARTAGDSVAAARLLTWLGLAAMRRGAYDEARSHGEAGLELKLRAGDRRELARSYNALGLLAMAEDRLAHAQRMFQHAMAAADAVADAEALGAATGNLGLIHAYLGDLDDARVRLGEMRDAAAATGNLRLQGNAHTNLAMVSIWAGDPQGALPALDSARALYREADYAVGDQYALGQLATALSTMGEYQRALVALDSALMLSRQHSLRDQEAENLRLLGGLFAEIGDPRRALRHLDESAEIARALGLHSELGGVLRSAGLVRMRLGSHDRARVDVEAALRAHRSVGEPFAELDDLLALAEIEQRSERDSEAQAALRSARLLADQLEARGASLAVALAEAQYHEQAGSPRVVLETVARARSLSLPADFRTQMQAHALAARAYAAIGQLDSSAAAGTRALRALERVRGSLASSESRENFAAASAQLYADLVLTLLRLGRTDEAFAVADAARSRELLQRLAGVREQADSMGMAGPELMLHRIDALLSQLQSLEAAPPRERSAGATATAAEIQARIARIRDEYESLSIRTARRDPRSAAVLGALATDAGAVRRSLASGEVLLHYLVTAEQVVIFVAARDTVVTVRVPVAAPDLSSRIRLLRELWSAAGAPLEPGVPAAESLHELLIAPVARAGLLAGATRLVIVPHGVLGTLPFAALRDRERDRYLVDQYILTYAPSASVLPAMRARAAGRRARTPHVYAFAPFPALPGAIEEAAAASRLTRGGRLHGNEAANEPALRRALGQSKVVHVASHAVLNARNPLFSRLVLARGRTGGSADDGRLEVHEVLTLDVQSPLVVLSGCETGLNVDWSGDPMRPSGVSTLAQAFLQAGARNVVATLWRIDDVGSAELVRRFYRGLPSGDAAAALAHAQRELIRSARYAAPYYWAGFMVMGDGVLQTSQ